MTTPSIPALQLLIDGVLPDGNGIAQWSAESGILTGIEQQIRDRSFVVYDDTSLLAMISGASARLAAVKNVGLYYYTSTGTAQTGDIVASDGARWVPLFKTQYSEVIGNSVATSFTITHRLNTLFPTILQMEPSSPGGTSGYTYSTLGTVTIVDANSFTIEYDDVPASYQFTIVVKK